MLILERKAIHGESDWLVTLIDQADSTEELHRKESVLAIWT